MQYFVYLDGDKIGSRIEKYLINNQIDEACLFSESINQVMMNIKYELSLVRDIEVKICGGDDLLIEFLCKEISDIEIETKRLQKKFYNETGSTMSGGGGRTIKEMLKNLSQAKGENKTSLILGGF